MAIVYPDPFLELRVQHIDMPFTKGLCAGYDGGAWRCERLADHLFNWLPFAALNQEHQLAFGSHNFVELLRLAAAHIYSTNKTATRGELGEVPVLSDPGSSTDFLVMNVNRDQLSPSGQDRQDRLPEETGLPEHILREHGAIGTSNLVELLRRIEDQVDKKPHHFSWHGFPDYNQKAAVAELMLYIAHKKQARVGVHMPKQVAWAWSKLQSIKSLPEFIDWFAGKFLEEGHPANVDGAFQFLQACEFSFPRSLAAIEAIIKYARPKVNLDYSVYMVEMENWFRPHWMKQLDEAGVPIPLGERLAKFIGPSASRGEALTTIGGLNLEATSGLDQVDQFILRMVRGEEL
ncbi:MAG TPA: hypothetical protein VM144_11050 [Aestuariivirga sp.]|nr:hypothetical protein [Aestuariivirga sp.]